MTRTISIARIRELVDLTGDGRLVWRINKGARIKRGQEVGSNFDGYRRVKLDGVNLLVHRVIFAVAKDRWPTGDVDHINGDKSDNRPENLREVTNRQNCQNRSAHRSGRLVGATFVKRNKRWQAQAWLGDRKCFLGEYGTEKEAHAAYMKFVTDNIS